MTMKILLHSSAALLLTLGLVSTASADHIDFIKDGGFFLSASSDVGPGTAEQAGDAGNILGSEREVMIDFGSGGEGFLSTGTVTDPPGDTSDLALLFDNSVNAKGTLTLTYDGVNDDVTGAPGLGAPEFTPTYISIVVDVPSIQGTGDLTVELYSGDSFTAFGSLTKSISDPMKYAFPFADPGYSSVDLEDIQRVRVIFASTTEATDVKFSQIVRDRDQVIDEAFIPEPTSLALGLLGICGLGLSKRGKRS